MFTVDLVGLISDRMQDHIADDKPWPVKLPEEGQLPAILYRRVSDVATVNHGGFDGYRAERFQFTFLAEKPIDAENLAVAFEDVFMMFKGFHGSTKFTLWDKATGQTIEGGADDRHYEIQDYIIHHKPID